MLPQSRDNLQDYDDKSERLPSVRQRKAAFKAWKTMRSNRQATASTGSLTIDKYLTLEKLGRIHHPELIDGKNQSQQQEVLSYSKGIISLFHKTPPDIACGRFWEVRWAYGCPLDCNYCYLRGTMRGNMKPSPLKVQQVLAALEEAFEKIQEPSIFNSGELSDSLMYPSLMEKIVDRFEQQTKHKIALLSKMGLRNIDFLTKGLRKQTICAWSINAPEVTKRWEKAAAPPEERIQAARMVSEVGYDTRVRIDPIFPIANWKMHYENLLYSLLSELEPRRIILGTPRGLWKTIKYAREAKIDMSWSNFFGEDSSWGKKLPFAQRQEIYQFFYDKLSKLGYNRDKVTMCKETTSMWDSMGLRYKSQTCNCYGPSALSE